MPDALHRSLEARAAMAGMSLSAYDAAYVALAEQLGTALITRDTRLATASGTEAQIELF